MSILPPGDLLLDVARAADPRKVQAAQARLQAFASGSAVAFDAPAPRTQTRPATPLPPHFVQFESMVLESFMKAMLPEDGESFYGEGLAGEMWRGLLAQELGAAMARGGGVGIAERVLGDYTLEEDRKVPVAGVSAGPQAEEAARQGRLAGALVHEIERRTAAGLAADAQHHTAPRGT